jgi:hypothetical protein
MATVEDDALLGGRRWPRADREDSKRRAVLRLTAVGVLAVLLAVLAYTRFCPCLRRTPRLQMDAGTPAVGGRLETGKLQMDAGTPVVAMGGRLEMRDDTLGDGAAWRVRVFDPSDGHQLTWAEVLARWRTDNEFGVAFSRKLAGSPSRAFFWETPPLSRDTLASVPFECVTLAARGLEAIRPDPRTFEQHIRGGSGQSAVAFTNLGGDSHLVSPCEDADAARSGELGRYAHIAAFVRAASDEQAGALWQKVAETAESVLAAAGAGDTPVWLSTEGSGVAWLHVRLDPRPKYFHWAPYTRAQ